ncbi:MAG: SAM-dependent methyltransferase [Actinomycetota bacterium]|nr:SAM-dependent methyltransferase [Actinomycetota bacterium]
MIEAEGPIRFDRYMDAVLYRFDWSYYRTAAPGWGAGYLTSPTITDAFGQLIAKLLSDEADRIGSNGLRVIEVGPGTGQFARACLDRMHSLDTAVPWIFVEPFDGPRAKQQETLGDRDVGWVDRIENIEPGPAIVFANEVIDNFPVRVFQVEDQHRVAEVYVGLSDGVLVEELHLLSGADESKIASAATQHLEPGDRFEWNQHMIDWAGRVGTAMTNGTVIVIDYGDEQPDLWLSRPAGSLVTYGPGSLGTDPYDSPGRLDITAHVDFTALSAGFSSAGCVVDPVITQRELLRSLGINELYDSIVAEQRNAEAAADHSTSLALLAERGRLGALTSRGGLGDLKVLIARKSQD